MRCSAGGDFGGFCKSLTCVFGSSLSVRLLGANTPSLPDVRPHSDRFRCGGREGKLQTRLPCRQLCPRAFPIDAEPDHIYVSSITMKRNLILMLLPLLLAAPVTAALSPIHINVEASNKAEHGKNGSSHSTRRPGSAEQSTQIRSLTINLENNSSETFNDLAVKYWFFGHDAKAHDPKPVKSGEKKASIGAHGRQAVHTETVSMKYTPEHVEMETRRPNVRGRGYATGSSQKKVAASGTKLTGYAVQVLNGAAVVAESYSEDSYKTKLGMGAPTLGDSKQGKKAGANPRKGKRQ